MPAIIQVQNRPDKHILWETVSDLAQPAAFSPKHAEAVQQLGSLDTLLWFQKLTFRPRTTWRDTPHIQKHALKTHFETHAGPKK